MHKTLNRSKEDNRPVKIHFYHPNHLGSTEFLTNFEGETIQKCVYMPYGETFIKIGGAPHLFNGKERDEESGLYYYGARYYDPHTNLWHSADPLWHIHQEISPYNFCVDNPVAYIDFFGLSEENAVLPEVAVYAEQNPFFWSTPTMSPAEYRCMHERRLKFIEGKTDWKPYAGAAASVGEELYYSEKYGTWMGKNFKLYKQTWGGNRFTGGKNKFAKKTSKFFERAGRVIGFASAASIYKQWYKEEINTRQFLAEESSNLYSSLGGLIGAAWGIGWELGRAFTQTEWYQEKKFNYYYDWWESQYGAPNEYNEIMWNYFFETYIP